ncbi:MAG: PAS domain-containing protein [Pirellulaceae bacterium]
MTDSFRSGNSRTLAKTLDQLGHPLAVLDRRGVIVFVNLPLCQLFKADATQLVGQSCSWQVAEDDSPFGALLTALAPPAGALQGKLVVRRLTTPIVFDSTQTGQLFIPLLDDEGTPQATLVALGE